MKTDRHAIGTPSAHPSARQIGTHRHANADKGNPIGTNMPRQSAHSASLGRCGMPRLVAQALVVWLEKITQPWEPSDE